MLSLTQRAASLSGRQKMCIEEKARLLLLKEDNTEILDETGQIQELLSDFEKEAFELGGEKMAKLLTAMLTDVFNEPQTLSMRTQIKRNQPELHFQSEKQGKCLDILSQRGGSVVNVLASALILIGLIQSRSRPVLFLDEADCWIAQDVIPRYFSVLAQTCRQLGVQIIFLSHHHQVPLLDTGIAQIPLANNPSAELAVNNPAFIDRIHIDNVLAHKQLHLPLKDGLNLIRGKNDSGKSCVLRAVQAMRSNHFDTEMFLHTDGERRADHGAVTLVFGDETALRWSVNAKKLKVGARGVKGVKTLYQYGHWKSGTFSEVFEEHEQPLGSAVPEFAENALAMFKSVNGLDVNISDQHNPLGLLNPAISPADRARLIDLGEQYEFAIKLFTRFREAISQLRSKLKFINEQIMTQDAAINRLKGIADIERLAQITQQLNGMKTLAETSLDFQTESTLEVPDSMATLLSLIQSAHAMSSKLVVPIPSKPNELPPALLKLSHVISQLSALPNHTAVPTEPASLPPELSELWDLISACNSFKEQCQTVNEGYQNFKTLRDEMRRTQTQIKKVTWAQQQGDVCPTCHQPWDFDHLHLEAS